MLAIDNIQIYLKVLERKDLYLFKKGNSSVTRFFRVTSKHKSPPPWLAFPQLFGPRHAGNDRSFDNKFSLRDILSQFPHSTKSKWLEFTILHKVDLTTCFFLDEFITSNQTLSISALPHVVSTPPKTLIAVFAFGSLSSKWHLSLEFVAGSVAQALLLLIIMWNTFLISGPASWQSPIRLRRQCCLWTRGDCLRAVHAHLCHLHVYTPLAINTNLAEYAWCRQRR